ncbi:MAG: tRNA (guanine(26)-N(2))-dimethyltransferase [Candidatus Syntrophoarchaeum sp. GoM_oil]|nr:MAG: tRNA (guanine(26)-N(2))-dimethyltransferase [Candidatus Syntrophoarchaeum sp. GoM_oil]
MNFKVFSEGEVKITIPEDSGVFYNPEMEITRDIDVATLSSLDLKDNFSYIDALAASGVRGLRVAKEVGIRDVTINDRSGRAFDCAFENARLEGIDAEVVRADCRRLLLERRYDIVDLDPFGSPSWILDAASFSVRRFLLVTATDTAPLCGSHRGGMQKYDALPLNTEYHSEVGLRILLGRVARDLMRHEKAVHPVLCYAKRHFIRLILEVESGAKKTDDVLGKMGYILHCFECGFRAAVHDLLGAEPICPRCGRHLRYTGVMYLGKTFGEDVVAKVISYLENSNFKRSSEEVKFLEYLSSEADIPFFYDHHVLCKRVGVTPAKIEKFLTRLRDLGFEATRVHVSGKGFKTDAPLDLIEDVLLE